ncbi:uncharacterized protein LOC107265077 isoform X2 [Cephus cinctus]|nr:uncharacterized protein LOC107265077 isoform X2 [Cephus cinctus]
MDNSLQYNMKHKIKEPIILLERCDKIFRTLKLIKHLNNTEIDKKDNAECKDEYSSDKSVSPYIKYQPLLCNGNGQLPYFNLSIKQSKSLILCEICGKGFSTNRNKNVHSVRVHGISLAVKTQRKHSKNVNKNLEHSEDSQNTKVLDKTKSTSMSALSKKSENIENHDIFLQSDKAMSDITGTTSTASDTEIRFNRNKTKKKIVMEVPRFQASCKNRTDDKEIVLANVKENEKNLRLLNALTLLKHKDIKFTAKSTKRTSKSPEKSFKSSPSKSPGKSPNADQGTWPVSNKPARNLLKNFMISSPEQTLMRRWLMSSPPSGKSTLEPLFKQIKMEKDDIKSHLEIQNETEPEGATPATNYKISERIHNSDTSSNHEVTSTVTDSINNSTPNNSPTTEHNKTVLRHNGMTMLPPPADVICTLCSRPSKNIKKHIVAYHKVTDPSLLVQESIAQSYFKDLMGSTDEDKDQTYKSDIESELQEKVRSQRKRRHTFQIHETTKEENPPSAKRSKPNKPRPASPKVNNTTPNDNNDTRSKRKSSTESNSKKKKTSERKPDSNTIYCCNICQRIVHGKYRLNTHNEAHVRRGETLENIGDHHQKSGHKSEQKSKKHKRAKSLESMTHSRIELNGVDESLKQANTKKGRNTKNSKKSKVKQTIQMEPDHSEKCFIKCICGKSFSNMAALDEHYISCDFNHRRSDANRSVTSPISRATIQGLSLTIKKRNDSYEIVHRDIGDEEMCNVSSHIKTNEPPSGIFLTSSDIAEIEDSLTIKKELIGIEEQNGLNSFPNFLLDMEFPEEDNNNIPTDVLGDKQQTTEKEIADPEALQLLSKDTPSSEDITSQIVNDHRCILCEKFFSSKSKILKHWSEHGPKLLCNCEENVINMQEYEDHIHRNHPEVVTCGYCAKIFDTLFDFAEHRCDVTKGKPLDGSKAPFPCLKCNKNFNKGIAFDRHVKNFHPDIVKPLQCYNCSLRFSTKDERKKHMTELHWKSKCNICYKMCTHGLKNKHESYHYGLGFPCHVCKKAYSNKESFTHHIMLTHISKIKCVICKKILKASSFKKHFRRHRNLDGLLQCILCKQMFSTNEHLINHHTQKHNFEKSCEICGMNFLTKSSVQQHIANMHPNVYETRNIIKEEITLES